ncbi:MAG: sodium:solute symporter family protein [Planctomycetes bacterium]|nr:sodium:solute symporter family protein [Planctomycetota bacterium]NOG53919.1 sodium:solute symporter family protein [Planctomycetota bacterium]
MHPWTYPIVGFLLFLTCLGVWHSRKIKTGEDFALAGRKLGFGVLVGTLVATWIGTGSLFGNAEFTYGHGLSALFLPLAGGIGILLLSFLAPRARSLPAGSVPQILGLRFGRAAQLIGAVALIGAYLIIVSYQYRAGTTVTLKLFPGLAEALENSEPGSAEHTAAFTKVLFVRGGFAAFIILYTVLAGMVSVAWTDLINGILMTVGLISALIWVMFHWDPATQPITDDMRQLGGGETPIAWVGFLLPAFLLVLGDANLHQRFMSAGSPRTARLSAIGMFFGVVVLEFVVIGLALFGKLMLTEEPANHGHVIVELAFTSLPWWIGLMIMGSATAVIITTADSYLLGAATSVAVDLHSGLTSPWKQRVIVLGIGLLALAISFLSNKYFNVALYAYTLYGATLTPAVVCALLLPRTPRAAVVGGMASGLGVALLWKIGATFEWLPAAFDEIDAVLPALFANVLVLITVALFLGPGDPHEVKPTA